MWVAIAGVIVIVGLLLVRSPTTPRSDATRFPWEIQPPPKSLVPLDEIVSGGPPPDGIPPIDEPKFVTTDKADEWLAAREPVIALERGGEARAYPLQILTWHEIVNDLIGDVAITVTFCPLCNSAIAFEREVGSRVLDFGTSGRLHRSNLVMYDRQTKSLWIQFTGKAVAGSLIGTELEKVPVQIVSWSDFTAAHPDGRVLSRETGESRDYGRNPYTGYDSVDSTPFLFDGPNDGRMRPMERVVAMTIDGSSKAYPYRLLQERAKSGAAVVSDDIAGTKLVVFYERGTKSALDAASLADSKDVGTTGVFESSAAGRSLHFEVRNGDIVDAETRSTWTIDGRATAGKLEGTKLEPIVHDDTFWFVWAAFRPDTSIWR